MDRMPKSVWERVACDTEHSRDACKSWFGGLADNLEGPIKANILTRTADDKTLKIRALFKTADGGEREMVRTMGGRRFSISCKPPSKMRWA